jgi:single-strand DNA-binding protein
MKMFGLARLGKDAELRRTSGGEAVCDINVAFNFGRKGDEKTQWVRASLWGKRAEALSQYLTKGKLILVEIKDPHLRSWTTDDGRSGSTLEGTITEIEFAGAGGSSDGYQYNQSTEAPREPSQTYQPKQNPDAPTFDDEIPF